MAINGVGSTRITGLVSGLDTDQIVSDLMRIEKAPLDKLKQKQQVVEWKVEEYREITNLLRGFKDEFFNNLKPSTNMLYQSSYKKYNLSSTDAGIVTASGNSEALPGTHTISVKKIATADKAESAGGLTKALEATPTGNYTLSGKTMNITLDGVTKEITLDNYTDLNDMITKADTGLQALADKAFGSGKLVITDNAGKLNFDTGAGVSKITLTSGTTDDGLAQLGFSSGSTNRINVGETLENLADKFDAGITFNSEDKLVFKINSKDFSFDKTTTLSSMISTINSDSTAGVKMQYDEITDKLTITSKQLGAGDNIAISQTGGTFFDGASKISSAAPITEEGVDAEVTVDGQAIIRSSNSFAINGVTYNITKAHENPLVEEETITVTQDTDAIFKNISSFVEKYNEILEKLNSKMDEKQDRNFKPLSDEQKEAMSDEEVKNWEEKARSGLLRNDSTLLSIVQRTRTAMYEGIEGISLSLSNIGITSGNYSEKGKLIIDETKLKEAISSDADGVMNLFSKQSTSQSSYSRSMSSTDKTERYNEEGIAFRLFDIIEDNISTMRDSNGDKGTLLMKAGILNDASEFDNLLHDQMNDYENRITDLLDKLSQKENYYYNKFAAMEEYISQMNAQSNWLTSQLES